ncbi:hypothetical protein [Paraburkholderia youngii]|uniref:hypothetical protein n=1 Tax=Paraburkholderia youngii TaxID=2782701 RepID=UPI003D192F33
MNMFKGHYTVHQLEDPHLSEVLAAESCPRRRSRLLVKYANLGCLLEKIGLSQTNNNAPFSHPDSPIVPMREANVQSISSALGEEFIANVLADFMSPAPDEPANKSHEHKGLTA